MGKTQVFNQVWQGNQITHAKYSFTALEINIMTLVFETLNRHGKNDYVTYHFPLSTLMRNARISDNNLHQVKLALAQLRKKDFEFYDGGEGAYIGVVLISGTKIVPSDDKVYFNIDPYIKPLLVDVSKNTTRYFRESIFAITRKSSKRIYHYCSQFKDTGIFYTDIDYLRFKMGLEGKYTTISMFRKKVLDPAVEEISTHTDLTISYELKKEGSGKTYTHIVFYIRNKAASLTVDGIDPKVRDTLCNEFNLARWQAENIVKTIPQKQLRQIIYEIRTTDGIMNLGGYAWKLFTDTYEVPKQKIG